MATRISQLHKTEAGWIETQESLQAQNKTFVPEAGELIIYDPDTNYPYARLKIGDGVTPLQDLPYFIDATTIENILSKRSLDAGRIAIK